MEDGLVILMKDDRIRRKPRERQAILDSGARAFVVTAPPSVGSSRCPPPR